MLWKQLFQCFRLRIFKALLYIFLDSVLLLQICSKESIIHHFGNVSYVSRTILRGFHHQISKDKFFCLLLQLLSLTSLINAHPGSG